MTEHTRQSIGFWIETPSGAQWVNQGMTRLAGFLIEGAALGRRHMFRVVVTDEIRDEAEADLAALSAQIGVDYTIHSPRDVDCVAPDFTALAEFANQHVPVDGWISIFPNQTHARHLVAPVSVIFPDAIGLLYHDFGEDGWKVAGHHVQWREKTAEHLSFCRKVITFSSHVANDHVRSIFGISADRIAVIPHAPPSLAGLLPFVESKGRTPDSLFQAASLLRKHAVYRGWRYLADFPFEHVRYAAVSTQDRVTKNIRIVADAVERLIRQHNQEFKLLMTARIHIGDDWTPLPATIERSQLHLDILSLPDLPRDVHAAFYHCAELAIHPSVFEGGRGAFPFAEAVSVGTPCILADGPHIAEYLEDAPELAPFIFDANDAEGLATMMLDISARRDAVLGVQSVVHARLQNRGWDRVADEYARAVTASA